ncbi:MAG: twitch domain-containing radical SAM protein [Acidobacteria bacterium]|nr:twitch domain-containing radical SAM protein [Acidobacteriota bacterium]
MSFLPPPLLQRLKRLHRKVRELRAGPREQALCILPWIHLHARTDGMALPCCVADEASPLGSLHTQSAVELFNSETMRMLRLDMLAGVRNPACRRCYALDDAGGSSLRQVFNREFADHVPEVENTAPDGSVDSDRIVYIDIRFSNLCNLRCRSCGSHSSTAWYQDDSATAPADFRILRPGKNPEELWAQIEPLLPRAEKMHFAGGEPMMMDETYHTLEKLLALGRTDVALTYNTNATKWTHRHWDAVELWKRFSKVFIMASVDGSGPRGEYIRKGMKWSRVLESCRRIRRELPHAGLQINYTIGLMNALHLPDFCDEILAEGLVAADQIALNPIQDPVYLSLTSLSPRLKARVRALYEDRMAKLASSGPEDVLRSRFREALDFMDSRDTSSHLGEFRRRTRELDRMRRESFPETFPELAELLPAGAEA